MRALYDASRRVGRELLVEIIAGKHGVLDDRTIERAMTELYDQGIRPIGGSWNRKPASQPGATLKM